MDPPDDQYEFSFPTSPSIPNFGPFSPPSGTATASSSPIFGLPPPSGTGASSSSSGFRLPPPSGAGATSSSSGFCLPPPSGTGASSSSSGFRLPPPSGAGASSSSSGFRLPPPTGAGASPFPVDLRLPPPTFTGAPTSPIDVRLSPPSGAGAGRPPRKRGRPRKDATNGQTVLAGESVAASSSTNRNRDGGQGFTPHFINVNAGEDVYQRLMQFVAETRGEMCIMSASGLIGSVTLRQPAGILRGTIRIQGEYDIVSLCGCYVRDGDLGKIGGFAVNLGGSNGEMIGGRIEGALIAAGPVQVMVATFVCEVERNVGFRMELPLPAVYRGGYADRGGRVRRRARQ